MSLKELEKQMKKLQQAFEARHRETSWAIKETLQEDMKELKEE